MKFTLMIAGILLVIIGTVAYYSIPNMHSIPVQTGRRITSPQNIEVSPGFLEETSENITIFPENQNQLRVNVAVSLSTGELSSIQFKLFVKENGQDCLSGSQPNACILNQRVANESINAPLNASNTYYLAFDNTGSNSSKSIVFSSFLIGTSVRTFATNDGSINFLGIGVGALGFLVALYGASRKTVIPWE